MDTWPASEGLNSGSGRNVASEFWEIAEHELREFMNAIKRQANPTFPADPERSVQGPWNLATWPQPVHRRFFY